MCLFNEIFELFVYGVIGKGRCVQEPWPEDQPSSLSPSSVIRYKQFPLLGKQGIIFKVLELASLFSYSG